MTATLALLVAFVMAGFIAPTLLARASWPYRSPRLAIAAWITASLAAASAAVLGLLTIAVPVAVLGHGLAEWWHACLEQWGHYVALGGSLAATLAAGGVILLLGRLVQSAVSYRRGVRAVRRRMLSSLALLAPADPEGIVVLPHPVPAAYCVPGRQRRVVLTDGAVRALDADQLRAVLAHERAHLTGRHDRLVGLSAVLHRALGWLAPVFALASRQIEALVEMAADDAAMAVCQPRRFAEAILTVAEATAPATTLAASGPDAATRIARLVSVPPPVSALPRLATSAGLAAALIMPVATVVASVLAGTVAASCPGDADVVPGYQAVWDFRFGARAVSEWFAGRETR